MTNKITVCIGNCFYCDEPVYSHTFVYGRIAHRNLEECFRLKRERIAALHENIQRLAQYYHSHILNFQYEKMGDYVRELEALLPIKVTA
jgi:hypothetical protein